MSPIARLLVLALFALTGLYAFWFANDPNPVPALMVFAAPPALLALLAWAGWQRAAFLSAVLALGWFSHGVMVTWTRPQDSQLASIEIVLALVVVFAASLPGLRERFRRKR